MKIYIADPAIRAEQIEAIRSRLPAGWSLVDAPDGATAILTENVDVSPAMIEAAGLDCAWLLAWTPARPPRLRDSRSR